MATKLWTYGPNMPSALSGMTAVVVGKWIVAVGG